MLLFPKTSKTTTAHGYLLYKHSKEARSTQNKPNSKRHQNTAHCRKSVKQTAQKAEKVVEHTVPDENGSGALNVMRSTRQETKGSQASNARRNGNGTDEKSGGQCAT